MALSAIHHLPGRRRIPGHTGCQNFFIMDICDTNTHKHRHKLQCLKLFKRQNGFKWLNMVKMALMAQNG